jgi:hypothetical protein
MKGEQELVNKIRSVMEPANPVPVSAYESDVLYQADLADRIAALRRQPRRRGRDGARSAVAWRVVAPALSGLAVVAVALSLALAGASAGRSPDRTGPAAGSAAGLPRYYVTINSKGLFKRFMLVVHGSLNGRTLAWLQLPKSKGINGWVTATRSDREFFIVADRTHGNFYSKQGLYRLRLAPDGHVTSFTTLSTNLGLGQANGIDGIALSPDGASLAVLVELTHLYSPAAELVVIPLNHPQEYPRVWLDRQYGEYAWDPIWTSNQDIAFLWKDHLRGTENVFPGRTQERLLNTAAPGSSLLSSRVLATSSAKVGLLSSALALPRGGPIIAGTYKDVPASGNHGRATVRLVAISPTTGKVTKVFFSQVVHFRTFAEHYDADFYYEVLGLDPTGRYVLGHFPRFGELTGGVVTPLPGGPGQVVSAAW